MAKQLITLLLLIARLNFSLKNYRCELFNLTRTVGKVELISTFTTVVFESWNVSDKYSWDNAGDLKQLSRDERLSVRIIGAIKRQFLIMATVTRDFCNRHLESCNMLFGTWSQAHAYDSSDYMETRLSMLHEFALMGIATVS